MGSKSVNKFHSKRHIHQGQMEIQTGIRQGEVQFRFFAPGVGAVSLNYQQLSDLADLADEALDEQDKNPIQ